MHLKCDPVWSNTRCVEQAKAFIVHSDAKVQFNSRYGIVRPRSDSGYVNVGLKLFAGAGYEFIKINQCCCV